MTIDGTSLRRPARAGGFDCALGGPAHADRRPRGPNAPRSESTRALLGFLLERAGVDEAEFWKLGRGQRGRVFLSRYSRVSRDIPQLEITAFDVDKLLKERFRHEPLTVGAAWHHGYWRSYFSHAAITHPANDGLREEFSTAWDIVRKHPRSCSAPPAAGRRRRCTRCASTCRWWWDRCRTATASRIERAYLEAIASADPAADLHTRSLVVMEWAKAREHLGELMPHAADLVLRIGSAEVTQLQTRGEGADALREMLSGARIVELEWTPKLAEHSKIVATLFPRVLQSVWLRYEDPAAFWPALEAAVRLEAVAMIHYHAGAEKSYRLTPEIDAFLKARFLRARVQLVSAGGNTDTQASAATVYESVLLGSNGGAMTHVAGIALAPELIDVYQGADAGAGDSPGSHGSTARSCERTRSTR